MLPLKKTASVRLFSTKMGADDEAGLRTAFNVHLGGGRLFPLKLTLDNDFEVDDFLGTQPRAGAGWSTAESTNNLQVNFATGDGTVWGHSCLSEPLDWTLTDKPLYTACQCFLEDDVVGVHQKTSIVEESNTCTPIAKRARSHRVTDTKSQSFVEGHQRCVSWRVRAAEIGLSLDDWQP